MHRVGDQFLCKFRILHLEVTRVGLFLAVLLVLHCRRVPKKELLRGVNRF